MVPTVFKTGRGVDELFRTVIDVYEGRPVPGKGGVRHVHLNHGRYIERGIDEVKAELQKNEQIRYKYSTRFLSIKPAREGRQGGGAWQDRCPTATLSSRHVTRRPTSS